LSLKLRRTAKGNALSHQHVFEDVRDDDASHRRSAAYSNAHGLLVITIHDRGPVVERAFGMSEYESTETFTADQTSRLKASLGDELIAAIAQRFANSAAFGKHCEAVGVGRGTLWNRIGD
jgi:hypothetical protein